MRNKRFKPYKNRSINNIIVRADSRPRHRAALLLAVRASLQHGPRARLGDRQDRPLPGLQARRRLPQGQILQTADLLQKQAAAVLRDRDVSSSTSIYNITRKKSLGVYINFPSSRRKISNNDNSFQANSVDFGQQGRAVHGRGASGRVDRRRAHALGQVARGVLLKGDQQGVAGHDREGRLRCRPRRCALRVRQGERASDFFAGAHIIALRHLDDNL